MSSSYSRNANATFKITKGDHTLERDRMLLSVLVTFLCLTLVSTNRPNWHQSSLNFFELKTVKFATGIFCSESDATAFMKAFATRDIQTNVILPTNTDYLEIWTDSTLTGVAVILDSACDFSRDIIEHASNNRLLDITRHWLIYADQYYPVEDLQRASYDWRPDMFDIEEFLNEDTNSAEHGEILKKFNEEINADILNDSAHNSSRKSLRPITDTESILKTLATMNAIVDSEVTIAVPSFDDGDTYELYEFYRTSLFTEMLIQRIGSMSNGSTVLTTKKNQEIGFSSTNFRTDFYGAIIRGVNPLVFFGYFSKSGELTTKNHDRFALMTLDIYKVLEEMLNFRTVMKCMDIHGWAENGKFTGAIGILYEQKAEVATAPLLMSSARMPAVDVVSSAFKLKLGMIFRDPNLSQVTNIFVLPFSNSVWLCVFALFTSTTFLMYGQLKSNKTMQSYKFWDILQYFIGAVCQQGTELQVRTLSVRFTLIVFLLSSLFLFTAYTANIVALLQSPSNLIKTMQDVVDSTFDVGVLNQQYIRKTIEEDNSSVTLQLKAKKINPKGENAYVTVPEGVKRVRNGLYAFQCNLLEAYDEIGRVFNEHEKCGLKQIFDYDHSISSIMVAKRSPYREIFKQKHLTLRENGFVTRAYQRWAPYTPACQSDGGRFASVGLVEVSSIFTFLTYGAIFAIIVLLGEKVLCTIHVRRLRKKKSKLGRQGSRDPFIVNYGPQDLPGERVKLFLE